MYGNWLVDQVYGYLNTDHDPEPGNLILKAHSHRARLRRYGTHGKRHARSHQARLRPLTDVDALKIEPCSILSAFTSVDGRKRAWCTRRLFPCVPYRRRCASTSVEARLRASTDVHARLRPSTRVARRT